MSVASGGYPPLATAGFSLQCRWPVVDIHRWPPTLRAEVWQVPSTTFSDSSYHLREFFVLFLCVIIFATWCHPTNSTSFLAIVPRLLPWTPDLFPFYRVQHLSLRRFTFSGLHSSRALKSLSWSSLTEYKYDVPEADASLAVVCMTHWCVDMLCYSAIPITTMG